MRRGRWFLRPLVKGVSIDYVRPYSCLSDLDREASSHLIQGTFLPTLPVGSLKYGRLIPYGGFATKTTHISAKQNLL